MEGCVPDSMRYVPGRGAVHVSRVVFLAATSVANDCTRLPCGGGFPVAPVPAMGHVVAACAPLWSGLGVDVAPVPRPPPNWPTMTSEVGRLLLPNVRLLVRLMARSC